MTKVLDQAQIVDLPFPDSVRLRKGMYISNLNQMVTEIIDNSVDEHFAGHCDMIAVVYQNGEYIIQDNGRGISSTKMPGKNITQVESAFTKLHSGGKFGTDGGYGKKTSGMNGVGGSVVQALSERMNVEVIYGGNKYRTDFSKGHITKNTHIIENNIDITEHGTTVTFKPDDQIWLDADPINLNALKKRVRQIAYLNPGLTMYYYVSNEGTEVEETYMYAEGLKTYVEELTSKRKRLTDVIGMATTLNEVDIQIGMTYTDSYSDELYTFCNNMNTVDNGDHLTGFTNGLTSAIKSYMEHYKLTFDCKTEDIKEGLVAVVAVRVADPNFEGQAKSKLKMPSVRTAVKSVTEQAVLDYLDKNPEIAKSILDKIEQASKARIAAAKARELSRKSKNLSSEGNPNKLAECSSKKPEECELWIVEGDSAGGSAKQGRDRRIQAILAVFGKINNVEKSRLAEVLKNPKLNELVKAGKFGIADEFDASKSRYHKYILASDADVDGFHITCLWITYIYRYLRPLLENGWLYVSCPPLFKITKGKIVRYAYSDIERDEIVAELNGVDNIQRYKGLGEMNPEQLWDTTMNPETRRLIQVTLEDAEACESAISVCMSEDTSARKEWIMENSMYANIE